MKKMALIITCAAVVVFMFGCSNEDESIRVAKGFWKAMEERDLEKAKSFATRETANSLTINEEKEDQDVEITFGEVTHEDGKTIVETTMQTSGGEMDMDIDLKTILVKEDGKWKVDVNQTMMSLFGGAMGAMMETMKEGMEAMGKEIAEDMKAGMEKMGNDLSNINEDNDD